MNQPDFHGSTMPYDLIDGAVPKGILQNASLAEQCKEIQDTTNSLNVRLELFEDLIESEIGDTSLVRARNLEREFQIRQLYLKFEGGNPTGTQKDRIAFAQALDALRRGFDTLTLATCGNYGVACAMASSIAGIRCRVYIPAAYQTKRITEMTDWGADIHRVDGDYENAVAVSQEAAEKEELYDANPGGNNLIMQLKAYGEIAYEIYDELRDSPALVAVPVSNGTTLAGVYRGFSSLYRRGKTSKTPKLIAGSSFRKNPIVDAYRHGRESCEDLVPTKIRESPINEPLINWHSIDGDQALEAIRESGGWASDATDRDMRQLAKLIREREGISVLPASTAGLVALLNRHKKEALPNDRYVIVLTGRKS